MNPGNSCTLEALMARVQTALQHAGIGPRDRVVVGVSGGCDSMALAHVMHALSQPMVVAHVHHGTRGHESDQDWAFVKAWAEQRGHPVEVLRLDADTLRGERQGFQGEARKARYAWFSALQTAHGARATLTAHHADDHVETALLNALRGLDPLGMRGMVSGGESAVRPFLAVWRSELEAVAVAEGWAWREDSSNDSLAYLRNRIRHELLPLLEDLRPGVKAHLQHLAHETAHLDGVLRPLLAAAKKRATRDGHRWDVAVLRNEPLAQEALVAHLLAFGWSRPHARRAVALVDAQAGKRVVAPRPRGGEAEVVRERHHLVVTAHDATPSPAETPETPGKPVVLSWENAPSQGEVAGVHWRSPSDPWPAGQRTPKCVWVPKAWFPVIWRPWRHGDRIRPVGMEGHAKVSDVLTQGKVPHLQRPLVRVLERSSDGEVLWVSGLKVSEDLRGASAAADSTEPHLPAGPAAADRTFARGMRLRVSGPVGTTPTVKGQPDQPDQPDQPPPR